jgi:uncharacterized membrane protein
VKTGVRNSTVDLLRTTAILIMLVANSAPYVLQLPHHPWLRLFSSLAAPLFIFLSGYSFFISTRDKNEVKKKWLSAGCLLITAALIDAAVWGIFPFQTFDVLYAIAAGIALNIFLRKVSWQLKLLLVLVIVFFGHLLRRWIGYTFSVEEIRLTAIFSSGSDFFQWKRLFVDGWFPLFPWLALSVLGSVVGETEQLVLRYWKLLLPGLLLIFFSSAYYLLYIRSLPLERDGYLELFYPATFSVMTMAISFSLGCFLFFSKFFSSQSPSGFSYFIELPGRHSLLVYLLHGVVIHYVFELFLNEYTFLNFSFLMLVFFVFFYALLYLRETKRVNNLIHPFPTAIKKILGL